jgi:ribosomal protein L37AE/L43A
MSERAVPYHCPYCGGENLRPHEPASATLAEPTNVAAATLAEPTNVAGSVADAERPAGHGAWECRECTRVFSVKLIGLVVSR